LSQTVDYLNSLKQTIKRKKESDGRGRLAGKFVGVNSFTHIAFVMRLQNLANWLLKLVLCFYGFLRTEFWHFAHCQVLPQNQYGKRLIAIALAN